VGLLFVGLEALQLLGLFASEWVGVRYMWMVCRGTVFSSDIYIRNATYMLGS
jgi:hypothetical protein